MHGPTGISDFGSHEVFESTLDAVGDTPEQLGSLGSTEATPGPRLGKFRRFDGSINFIFPSLTHLAQEGAIDR